MLGDQARSPNQQQNYTQDFPKVQNDQNTSELARLGSYIKVPASGRSDNIYTQRPLSNRAGILTSYASTHLRCTTCAFAGVSNSRFKDVVLCLPWQGFKIKWARHGEPPWRSGQSQHDCASLRGGHPRSAMSAAGPWRARIHRSAISIRQFATAQLW